MKARSIDPSNRHQYFLTVVPLPDVLPLNPVISVQSAGVLGAMAMALPTASTVAMMRSLRPLTSLAVVPVGRAGVTLVPLAVVAEDEAR